MTFLTTTLIFILGLLLLLIGLAVKEKWLKLASLIPLGVAGWQFTILFFL